MCTVCKGPHHKSICDSDRTKDAPVHPTNVMSFNKIEVALTKFNNLQNAKFRIVGPSDISKVNRCIKDSGSQNSFVNTSIIDTLK